MICFPDLENFLLSFSRGGVLERFGQFGDDSGKCAETRLGNHFSCLLSITREALKLDFDGICNSSRGIILIERYSLKFTSTCFVIDTLGAPCCVLIHLTNMFETILKYVFADVGEQIMLST